ncbi:phosphoenolpyruvate--protein phosphotransferase [Ferrovum myxofaciens]|jgi:phosphotransferase system enzyme I (PtsI)|uniref:Phosphoenolpyruvate-protein phosphotransferase n=5 Tax=root TaxID=1 RepID=A0A859A8F9_9PROT|nr:phosphoenolpyruvate--protein phosphotransferase [Ferrovum myxofaciens]KXW59390.1 phosphoenolpyruvate-protein phosphotransferase [Ferrovum myxofaciens]MBU6994321.1 phosphoenolpyruvate--protein phosphotransferase [Ferrovum myxofaciens]QKE38221.1 MAG: phosphoenolpyruvate--protein phosphotransferase [Ferrovum myxofaciens]QWY75952.1 MAG: phosphoenolpyruvate--protein phosphotransferase [Ferrovum myxofaciens]QWY78684.1 MAG: phosphoenolpyruvate--protein phosphotransferase [Ferrovum myxofaciens]
MSFALHGSAVAHGIAIGRAHLFSQTTLEVTRYIVLPEQRPAEIQRFEQALHQVTQELEELERQIPLGAPAEMATFLQLHRLILKDEMLARTPKQCIQTQGCNAEWALKQQLDNLIRQFEEMEDPYLRQRRDDIWQVGERVLKALTGQPAPNLPAHHEAADRILVAHDLSPADMVLFKEHPFQSFITDIGGATSHTAILARSLGIPSVVALHHAWQMIREGELLIVDGMAGVVIVNPDNQILAEYRLRQEQWSLERQKLKRLRTTRATTLDGTPIELLANIEMPGDVDAVKKSGARGIGLFRTEFLFMNRSSLPGEEEQFHAYRQVAEALRGLPVTIRTLDIGADKPVEPSGIVSTLNPALGLRAIRYCLAEPQIFLTQIRAILRASHFGQVQMLLPMLSSRSELLQTLTLVEQAKAELTQQAIPFNLHLPIGGMIEVPAAALALPLFLDKLDFLSIGTNDLIQYTLAIDRTDDAVAHLFDPLHPAVLMLIAHTLRTAQKAGKPIAICGEMAGNPTMTRLLLGFGLREFSMHPAHLPEVKQVILKTSLADLQNPVKRMLSTHDPDKLEEILTRLNQQVC